MTDIQIVLSKDSGKNVKCVSCVVCPLSLSSRWVLAFSSQIWPKALAFAFVVCLLFCRVLCRNCLSLFSEIEIVLALDS
jgi:hypothetical protein